MSATTRPGLKMGQVNEFRLITPLKPGGGDRLGARLPEGFTVLDNDTR